MYGMQAKLTLRLDDSLIKKARLSSQKSGKSLSRIVADYFAALDFRDKESLPPRTRSLRGILSGSTHSEADYKRHLEEKHL